MLKDVESPASLTKLQAWFGNVITQPIDESSSINPLAPSGKPIEEEAKAFIKPSKTLSPKERMQIYNQQYWWRLLNIMHENFPLVTRLFGYYDFNQTIAIPYLEKHPPGHWSLAVLGETLPQWIEEKYQEDDKALVLDAARLDWAFNMSFSARELKPIDIIKATTEEEGGRLLTEKVMLQPHLFLLELKYDLIPFRSALLKEDGDHFVDHDFPKLKKQKKHLVIYRTPAMFIEWKEISAEESVILGRFREGRSIEDVCSWLETQQGPLLAEAEKNLLHWFHEWTALNWIGLVKSS
ncbi:DNA-binding domain-containing protein [Estrella lausannensis]|uniref:Putative DNA-binding domain-containing protein n=1 Tax=Estrella lausannensis TaxID=483423 RepID=A0A0H5DNT8_9BACT|nr:DNA-binding domain-containing protein [Estrella lausannensis]CRX37493.1 Conserved hypothetical protein [Estrella lausannensis]